MNIINTDAYRTAFVEYLRRGTPILRSLKAEQLTNRYVWRTRRDGKVRPAHRRNDGRIFRWSDAPETGHPGEGFNCRCEAVPYVEGSTEFASHDTYTGLASSYGRWENHDFIWHFYTGQGRGVTLSEIGHLREIVEQYAYHDGDEGAYRRLSDQIAREARDAFASGRENFVYTFGRPHQFKGVEFSHGKSTVKGVFSGSVTDIGKTLRVEGTIRFEFEDAFTDPVDLRQFSAFLRENSRRARRLLQSLGAAIGVVDRPRDAGQEIDEDDVSAVFFALSELGGTAYPVIGAWTTLFRAEIFKNDARSRYFDPETE